LLAESQRIAHIGSFRWDLVTGQIEWSDECYRLHGVTREDFTLTAEAGIACIHPDDRPAVRAWVSAQAGGTNPKPVTYRTIRPDGSSYWLVTNGEMQRDAEGRPLQLVGTTQDITERKRADAALMSSEARYRALVESIADVVCIADFEGRFTYANPQVHSLLGYSPQEVVGRQIWDLMTPEEGERQRPIFAAHVTAAMPFHLTDVEHRHRDGHAVITEVIASPIFGEDKTLLGYQGTIHDITERRRTEETLRTQLDELRRWQDVMLDREDRIQALKQEVNELLQRDGQPIRYPSQTLEASGAGGGTP